jgi:hypothetical protein
VDPSWAVACLGALVDRPAAELLLLRRVIHVKSLPWFRRSCHSLRAPKVMDSGSVELKLVELILQQQEDSQGRLRHEASDPHDAC